FLFSSRRRHTRFSRDWSSDVCSSDLAHKIRTEKIAIKDVKLRTFIADDSSRDDLVAHVYDVTYGVIKPQDNLVIIDDSIVRGNKIGRASCRERGEDRVCVVRQDTQKR